MSEALDMLDGAWEAVAGFAGVAAVGWGSWVVMTCVMAGLVTFLMWSARRRG